MNQLNKDEEKNADGYKKDMDKLKNMTNHIIDIGKTIQQEQAPENKTKLEEIKRKILTTQELNKSKSSAKSSSFKMSSSKISPKAIPGAHIFKD